LNNRNNECRQKFFIGLKVDGDKPEMNLHPKIFYKYW
jgi:hypothetical protein